MGRELIFGKGHGPQFPDPVRTRADIEGLTDFDPVRDLPAPLRAIQLTNERARVPILGFAGSPFTLACYLVEGGGSKTWHHTKSLMWSDPEAFSLLLDKLAVAVGDHLQAQVEHGAAAVQLFDTWAGALSSEDFRRFALPAARKALSRVSGAPTLYFTRVSGPLLPWLRDSGADAIGLDWRVDLGRARAQRGRDLPVQGTLDPSALSAPADEIRRQVHTIIEKAAARATSSTSATASTRTPPWRAWSTPSRRSGRGPGTERGAVALAPSTHVWLLEQATPQGPEALPDGCGRASPIRWCCPCPSRGCARWWRSCSSGSGSPTTPTS